MAQLNIAVIGEDSFHLEDGCLDAMMVFRFVISFGLELIVILCQVWPMVASVVFVFGLIVGTAWF